MAEAFADVPVNRPTGPVGKPAAPADSGATPGLTPGQVICPYCGHQQESGAACQHCKGLFEPLSRQATQNAMGPWQVRNEKNPFGPGCSYEKLREMIARGRVTRTTILRGPSTRQFWSLAMNAPGVAVLLSECHNCHSRVGADEYLCRVCGAVLTWETDRQHLGLAPMKRLPSDGPPSMIAAAAFGASGGGAAPVVRRPASPADVPIGYVGPNGGARQIAAAPAPSAAVMRGVSESLGADVAEPMQVNTPSAQSSLARTRLAQRRRQGLKSALITVGVLGIVAVVIVMAVVLGPARTPTVTSSGVDDAASAAVRGVVKERSTAVAEQAATQAPGAGQSGVAGLTKLGETTGPAQPKGVGAEPVAPVTKEAEKPPLSQPPSPTAPVPEAAPKHVGAPADATRLDPGLEQFQVDFERALALEQKDTIASIEAALEILSEIKDFARQRARKGESNSPSLDNTIERMKARLDRLKLKEIAR